MADDSIKLDDNLHWYKDAIIYELHIKAFKDGNGDGIGDFKGLLEKLDYLQDIGVTAIWLLPFYPSPLRDDGYDIADYYTINPSYGKLKDLQKFLKQAHKRGLKVITELVLNHTSDQHPWFQRARRAAPGSVERDFYVWNDDINKYKDVRIIFQDFETSNWTWDPVAKAYFWHRFYAHQPDLNFDNPAVQEEVFKVLDYWIDMGVDGFRLDAVPYLFERDGTNCENLPETHAFLKKLRKQVENKKPDILLLAEANMWPEDSAAYFGDGDECHMNYHFPIMPRMFMSVRMEDRYPITDILDQTPAIPETCQWAMFLRNHDELTLEMVTDEERDYMYKVYAKDPLAKINLGIRHRLAPLLDNDRRKIELMNHLLFSLPGTPVLYYGDEIGMGDNYYLGDRDGVRTPMQWSPDRNAGFSEANPQKLYLPVILDPEYSYEAVNVETQSQNANSLLWWMKHHINMRKNHKAFSRGDIEFLGVENSKIIAFTRTYEDETILVMANLSRFSQAAEIDLSSYADAVPVELFSKNRFPIITGQRYLFTLSPYNYQWFLLEKPKVVEEEIKTGKKPLVLSLSSWDDVGSSKQRAPLEKALPAYLNRSRWFGGKARVIQSITVKEHVHLPIKGTNASLLILEVSYNEGLNEYYQLPISFIPDDFASTLAGQYPQSIIMSATLGDQEGKIFDAMFSDKVREYMFTAMAKKKRLKVNGTDLVGFSEREVNKTLKEKGEISSHVLSAEQSNTSVIYEKDYFYKIYRKLDQVDNPDLEITRFLSEVAKFPNVPQYMGHMQLEEATKSPYILGMMQQLVPNQGDAWTYMLDAISRYYERILLLPENELSLPTLKGDLSNPVGFDKMPDQLKDFISGAPAERASLLGIRTAEMHIALASQPEHPGFEPEDFSLHYQRSLYSSLQTLVRTTYQSLDKNFAKLPEAFVEDAEYIKSIRKDVLAVMKNIYAHKIDAMKIRTHGDYHLGQVLFTGKDFIILDFEGEPARTFSERRLKRSPLRDVAGMIRSFHYAAYSGLFKTDAFTHGGKYLEEWAEQWYHYMSGFYLRAYLNTTKGKSFIPSEENDFEVLIQTFLLEKAVYELNYELNNRPDWAIIPMKGIKYVMKNYFEDEH